MEDSKLFAGKIEEIVKPEEGLPTFGTKLKVNLYPAFTRNGKSEKKLVEVVRLHKALKRKGEPDKLRKRYTITTREFGALCI